LIATIPAAGSSVGAPSCDATAARRRRTRDGRQAPFLLALAPCRGYLHHEGRDAQVLASVLSAARHDPALRDASRQALGEPYGDLFERVLSRAVDRGLIRRHVDVRTLAQVFPAIAYQRVAAQGLLVHEDDVVRVVDGVLLPAMRNP
jgi:hypothetical protein